MATENFDPLIFIIDDSIEIIKMLSKIFTTENFTKVQSFSSFDEFQKALSLNPDIIIMDNYLDVFQKDEEESMANFLLVQKQLPDSKIIILSGESDPEIVREFILHGAFGYVIKNTDAFDKIIDSIHQITRDHNSTK